MKWLKQISKQHLFTLLIVGVLFPSLSFAGAQFTIDGENLGGVAKNFALNMNSVGRLIGAISYVAGLGFALMGMFKLKAHKDQPAQVPMSQGFVLLVIASGLIFLPSLVNTVGKTLWGEQAIIGSSEGDGITGLAGL